MPSSSLSSHSQDIVFESLPMSTGFLGLIKLQRAKQLNALNRSMIEALFEQVKKWEQDESCNLVVIVSELEKAFCVGGDVKEIYRHISSNNKQAAIDYLNLEYDFDFFLRNMDTPVVCYSQGMTFGGGFGVFMGGRFRLASENASFAMPESAIGFFPDVGAGEFFAGIPLWQARALALSGVTISASDCAFLGFCKLCSLPQKTLISNIQHLEVDDNFQQDLETSLESLADCKPELHNADFHANISWLYSIFSSDNLESLVHKALNVPTSNPWQQSIQEKIRYASPLSMAMSFEYFFHTRDQIPEYRLLLEKAMGKFFVDSQEVAEGVRALLVDKDKKPKWAKAHFAESQEIFVEFLCDCVSV